MQPGPWEKKFCLEAAKTHVIREQTVPIVYDAIFSGKSIKEALEESISSVSRKG